VIQNSSSTLRPCIVIQKSDLIDIPESVYELSLLLVFVLRSRCDDEN
jgi:hypothetical protein